MDESSVRGTAPDTQKNTFQLKDVEIGKEDRRGRIVLDILWADPDFAIYRTKMGVGTQFSDDPAVALDQFKRYLSISNDLSRMNYLIHQLRGIVRRWFPTSPLNAEPRYYEREMSNSIAQALILRPEDGVATLSMLTERLEKCLQNRGRVKFFLSCLAAAVGICLVAYYLVPTFEAGTAEWKAEVRTAMIAGSVGALLSASIALKQLEIDVFVSLQMHILYGSLRILVGVLGALVLLLAMKSGIALDFILAGTSSETSTEATLQPNSALYMLGFVSVIAGFSERLVPNLLDRNGGGGPDAAEPGTSSTGAPATGG